MYYPEVIAIIWERWWMSWKWAMWETWGISRQRKVDDTNKNESTANSLRISRRFKCILQCGEWWMLHSNRKRYYQWTDAGKCPSQILQPILHRRTTMVSIWWSLTDVIDCIFSHPSENVWKVPLEIEIMHYKVDKLHPQRPSRRVCRQHCCSIMTDQMCNALWHVNWISWGMN